MGKPGVLSYGPYEHKVETYYDPRSRRWLACRWGEYKIGHTAGATANRPPSPICRWRLRISSGKTTGRTVASLGSAMSQ